MFFTIKAYFEFRLFCVVIMADDDVGANQLVHGEFILHKAEVIFFKKKRTSKKKKQPKKQRAIMVITKADVGLNDGNMDYDTLTIYNVEEHPI